MPPVRPALGDGDVFPALALGHRLRPPLHGVGRWPQLQLGVAVQLLGGLLVATIQRRLTLLLKRPVIDALHFADTLQRAVLQLGPEAAHLLDLDAAGFCGIQHPRLGREPPGLQLAGGRQNMGVVIALITFAVGRMDRHIDGHAVAADQLLGKLAGDL